MYYISTETHIHVLPIFANPVDIMPSWWLLISYKSIMLMVYLKNRSFSLLYTGIWKKENKKSKKKKILRNPELQNPRLNIASTNVNHWPESLANSVHLHFKQPIFIKSITMPFLVTQVDLSPTTAPPKLCVHWQPLPSKIMSSSQQSPWVNYSSNTRCVKHFWYSGSAPRPRNRR